MNIYVVEVTHRCYVQADSEKAAMDFSELVVDCDICPQVTAYKTDSNDLGWEPESLIYTQNGSDVTVEEIFGS